jgi:hypothetical protein
MSQSQFPKMGEHPLEGSLVNMSGQRSPYTTAVPRNGASNDSPDDGGDATHRGQMLMSGEHNGPTFRPVTTLYQQNAAAASDIGRGMRTVPSALGDRDFWDQRASSSGEVIS